MMNPLMSASIIEQIRALQQKGESFWLELSNGRIIQVYSTHSIATTERIVAVLSGDDFELIAAEHISAVGNAIHPKVEKELQERRAEAMKRFAQ
jgi:hypothetical protein